MQTIETSSQWFSLQTLNEMFDNDSETVFGLLKTFTTSLHDDIQKLENAFEEKSRYQIQQIAHRILPFCKQIHAQEVIPILEKITRSGKETEVQFYDFKEDTILLILKLKRLLAACGER
jgi:HPt (histidine-containing phosphotransfer) domain-containing protein